MDVKPGYKQNEARELSKQWKRKRLGDVLRICHGRNQRGVEVSDGPYPILATGGQIGWASQSLYDRPSVLIGRKGTINKPRYMDSPFWTVDTLFYSEMQGGNSAQYFYYLFCTIDWMQFNEASGVPSLNARTIENVEINCPEPSEQSVVAAVLSDVDALLDGLDRLVAKKRYLKQAAMQQLLTGQTRLSGFHGEWEVKRLGELGHFIKGRGVKKDEARSGDIACIRYGEIYTHHNDYVRSFNSWISREVANTAIRLKRGDLLFAGSGETKEEIGKCVAFVDEIEAYAGGDIVILRPAEANSLFLGYLLNAPTIATQKASRGQGDAVVHISAGALASIELSLPSYVEQTAIAGVLAEMDAELVALEARRDKTRALKQGMMQELLTGRTRLV